MGPAPVDGGLAPLHTAPASSPRDLRIGAASASSEQDFRIALLNRGKGKVAASVSGSVASLDKDGSDCSNDFGSDDGKPAKNGKSTDGRQAKPPRATVVDADVNYPVLADMPVIGENTNLFLEQRSLLLQETRSTRDRIVGTRGLRGILPRLTGKLNKLPKAQHGMCGKDKPDVIIAGLKQQDKELKDLAALVERQE